MAHKKCSSLTLAFNFLNYKHNWDKEQRYWVNLAPVSICILSNFSVSACQRCVISDQLLSHRFKTCSVYTFYNTHACEIVRSCNESLSRSMMNVYVCVCVHERERERERERYWQRAEQARNNPAGYITMPIVLPTILCYCDRQRGGSTWNPIAQIEWQTNWHTRTHATLTLTRTHTHTIYTARGQGAPISISGFKLC